MQSGEKTSSEALPFGGMDARRPNMSEEKFSDSNFIFGFCLDPFLFISPLLLWKQFCFVLPKREREWRLLMWQSSTSTSASMRPPSGCSRCPSKQRRRPGWQNYSSLLKNNFWPDVVIGQSLVTQDDAGVTISWKSCTVKKVTVLHHS